MTEELLIRAYSFFSVPKYKVLLQIKEESTIIVRLDVLALHQKKPR